jgi:hypothetical protein
MEQKDCVERRTLLQRQLLYGCTQFASETGATVTVQFATPAIRFRDRLIMLRLYSGKGAGRLHIVSTDTKLKETYDLIFYPEPFASHNRDIKDTIYEAFGIRIKSRAKSKDGIPFFSLPFKTYKDLEKNGRVMVDEEFMEVCDPEDATFIFSKVGDGYQVEQNIGKSQKLSKACKVISRNGLGNYNA